MRRLPFDLTDRFASWRPSLVGSHDPDAPTYLLRLGEQRRYVKLAPAGRAIPDEAQKMRWAAAWLPVPEVVEYGSDGETDWLMTLALPGVSAPEHPRASERPRDLVVMLAEGLRAFHEAVKAADCPFDSGPAGLLARAQARVAAGLVRAERFRPEHAGLSAEAALERLLAGVPEPVAEVVCHGDYRVPTVFVDGDRITGHLDLGGLGAGDPWWDLAVASWSCAWHFGPGHEELFVSVYGVEVDRQRLAWYRLLHDVS